ncbi:hypothetical protein [Hymenobacter arizonensis]|uniref:Uncharacterized protein n=1 Tax=Hymenobacter arizonensis TaxID=1227077 RepID=A0A1I6BT29_HYMAR|nr:hypothetical protein [Hymenobacter arizonensis]SFQ84070.1 hypothetical protein SAMN04515668_5072 [Hymenobacter arizonensis]
MNSLLFLGLLALAPWRPAGGVRSAGPGPCLSLALQRPAADPHRVNLVVRAACPVGYKCSLELRTPDGEWAQVLENVEARVQAPYGFTTPIVTVKARQKVLGLAYPRALGPRDATAVFRVKVQYVEEGAANPGSTIKVLYTPAFRF